MAKVIDRSRPAGRGQLLLVGGLSVAILLIVLVLLLNSVIFTENVATRSVNAGGAAIEYHAAVVSGVGGLLDAENVAAHGDNTTGVDDIADATGNGTVELDNGTAIQLDRRGAATSVAFDEGSPTEGVLLREENRTEFEDGDNASVEGADGTRDFVFHFDPNSTTNRTDLSDVLNGSFRVRLNETGGNTLYVYAYVDDSTNPNEFTIATAFGDGLLPDPACSTPVDGTDEIRFDLTGGFLDGERCDVWPDFEPDGIELQRGAQAGGDYRVTVNSNDTSADVASEAVYSVAIDIEYRTAAVDYRATGVRVAPGEPDD